MKKYVCNICGYVYDPAVGDSESGIKRGLLLKSCPRIGSARFAGLPSPIFLPNNNPKGFPSSLSLSSFPSTRHETGPGGCLNPRLCSPPRRGEAWAKAKRDDLPADHPPQTPPARAGTRKRSAVRNMPIPGNLLTTAMAVMPHKDVDRALELALSLDIPFWPQLPRVSYYEDMYVQASEHFPGIVLDLEKRTLRFSLDKFVAEYEEALNRLRRRSTGT